MQLNEYNFPTDIKHMSIVEMEALAKEIRSFLIEKVSRTGGHLASNLGVVELTLALHKVFTTPKDKIIWDVGHQAYVHKILTKRADQFDSLRQLDGLSGFPKRDESEHDLFNAGHSSNSISVAFGMAKARDLQHKNHAVIAVIGDGALTGGVAFEALNNAGHADENGKKTNLLVVLNDNEMSIGRNTGGITQYLSSLRSTPTYNNFKRTLKKNLKALPLIGQGTYRLLESVRDMVKFAVIADGVFEGLGFKYLGPIDGHHLEEVISMLEGARNIDGPVLLHVITKKGKGYAPAELNPDLFHGIGSFDSDTGKPEELEKPAYSKVFGDQMIRLAGKNKHVVAISAAMVEAVGLGTFKDQYPDRLFDVAIAEQHAVDFAAGLALEGYRPVVAIYSTFMQRAYDQILIDVCAQNLPVVFCLDRAGNVGNDGETHHGIYDLSYLTHMPGMTVMAPKDGRELERMLEYAITLEGPVAIRYPRGVADDFSGIVEDQPIDGRIEIIRSAPAGSICLLGLGRMVRHAVCLADILEQKGFEVAVINARFAKPLDEDGIAALAAQYRLIVTLEDNTVIGGFGAGTAEMLSRRGIEKPVLITGWPDEIIRHGSVEQLEKRHGLTPAAIAEKILTYKN